jgi:hypothetical protein
MTAALALLVLGLVDASFSGFRAYAGRDARIRKHRADLRAGLRGLAVGTGLLLGPALVAGVLLLTAGAGRAHTYRRLAAGGTGYLLPLAAFAALVLLSLAAYFVLPVRASTLAMVIGLGPLTLLRPFVVAGACVGSQLTGGGPPALLVGVVAAAAVLGVEPLVHRRWYREVQ